MLSGGALGFLTGSQVAAFAYGLALVVVGCVLQWRAERKQAGRVKVFDAEGALLDGRERDERLQQLGATLVWEAAGRPGLPTEGAE